MLKSLVAVEIKDIMLERFTWIEFPYVEVWDERDIEACEELVDEGFLRLVIERKMLCTNVLHRFYELTK